MSFTADAHREWHTVHGAFASCPLDCGINEPDVWTCTACGGDCVKYPSSEVYRACTYVASCDRVMAVQAAEWEAKRVARTKPDGEPTPWDVPF